MSENDRAKWEQAPDGTWHRRSWWSRYGLGVLAVAVVVSVAGAFYFNWKADQDRLERDTRDMTCAITGSC